MHSGESAITKISPWKVQEFAEEEGPTSPFATLTKDITRLLITILMTSTACSIYSTALFVSVVTEMFPHWNLGFITAALTIITLFFGELLPKALAVSNSELVARKLVPIISRLALLLAPITTSFTFLSDLMLSLAGLRSKVDDNVSTDMLRMVVDEAQRTAGINTGEGRMIKAVLDIQEKEVSKIMTPRVEMIAIPTTAPASTILQIAMDTKYSRLPVYKNDVDHIEGIIFSKDLLDFMQVSATGVIGGVSDGADAATSNNGATTGREDDMLAFRNQQKRKRSSSSSSSKKNKGKGFGKYNYQEPAPSQTLLALQQKYQLDKTTASTNGNVDTPQMRPQWSTLTATDMVEPNSAYFIPESMSCWTALQEVCCCVEF